MLRACELLSMSPSEFDAMSPGGRRQAVAYAKLRVSEEARRDRRLAEAIAAAAGIKGM